MLIEILGNSSSVLVILLIGLSIYFGIQANRKKNKQIQLYKRYKGKNQKLTLLAQREKIIQLDSSRILNIHILFLRLLKIGCESHEQTNYKNEKNTEKG